MWYHTYYKSSCRSYAPWKHQSWLAKFNVQHNITYQSLFYHIVHYSLGSQSILLQWSMQRSNITHRVQHCFNAQRKGATHTASMNRTLFPSTHTNQRTCFTNIHHNNDQFNATMTLSTLGKQHSTYRETYTNV